MSVDSLNCAKISGIGLDHMYLSVRSVVASRLEHSFDNGSDS